MNKEPTVSNTVNPNELEFTEVIIGLSGGGLIIPLPYQLAVGPQGFIFTPVVGG
jgi:hypothetical protein